MSCSYSLLYWSIDASSSAIFLFIAAASTWLVWAWSSSFFNFCLSGSIFCSISAYFNCATHHFTKGPQAEEARLTVSKLKVGSDMYFFIIASLVVFFNLSVLKSMTDWMKSVWTIILRTCFQSFASLSRIIQTASIAIRTAGGGFANCRTSTSCCFRMPLTAALASSTIGSTSARSSLT